MATKEKTYKFYGDNGHGWLAVKRLELIQLGIFYNISTYSYQKGKTVYLEEDCDASQFIKAKTARDGAFKIIEVHHEGRSPIRSYDHFSNKVGVE